MRQYTLQLRRVNIYGWNISILADAETSNVNIGGRMRQLYEAVEVWG
jgi:hypothetical protein